MEVDTITKDSTKQYLSLFLLLNDLKNFIQPTFISQLRTFKGRFSISFLSVRLIHKPFHLQTQRIFYKPNTSCHRPFCLLVLFFCHVVDGGWWSSIDSAVGNLLSDLPPLPFTQRSEVIVQGWEQSGAAIASGVSLKVRWGHRDWRWDPASPEWSTLSPRNSFYVLSNCSYIYEVIVI